MRAKVIIPVGLFGLIGLLAISLAHRRLKQIDPAPPEVKSVSEVSPDTSAPSAVAPPVFIPAVSAAAPDSTLAEPETHEDYINRRIGELMDLAMTDEQSALVVILSELTNPDAQVRNAAVDAAVQFKSPDAIPSLQGAYNRTDDPQEKIRISSAIEFLAVPAASPIAEQN